MSATYSTAKAAYLDNADFDVSEDVAKCRLFITACRQLLVLLPSRSAGFQASETEFSTELLEKQLASAREWLADQDLAEEGVIHTSLEYFRD